MLEIKNFSMFFNILSLYDRHDLYVNLWTIFHCFGLVCDVSTPRNVQISDRTDIR